MSFPLIMLGFVGWVLLLLAVLILIRMSDEQDREARHTEKALNPYSDVTITVLQGDFRVRRSSPPRRERASAG